MPLGGWAHDGLDIYNAGSKVRELAAHEKITLDSPAVIMINPKYPHNVGQAVRLCSCYGIQSLVMTGSRVPLQPSAGYRLPREERMRGYRDVTLYHYDRPFDLFEKGTPFVGVEVRENAEKLPLFSHPDKAVYVFGPEDASLTRTHLQLCHRFVVLPTKHCLNLATAIGTVLYDRQAKEMLGL